MIVCLVCGTTCDAGPKNCPKCGAIFPKMDFSTSASSLGGGKETGRFNSFQDACRKVKTGQWTGEEFANFLFSVQGILQQMAAEHVAWLEESGYAELSIDEVEMHLSGIEDYEVGMETLAQFVDTGDMSLIDQGLQIIWEGNEKINEGQRLSLLFRKSLDEEWGYME